MHLNKILEQIKRHQSPTEAIDKLATALEKHEGSLLEKGFTILKSELAANMYEAINGPHFDEEHAHYAVEGMENEDGTKGPHWTVEETTSVANQKARCGTTMCTLCVTTKKTIIKHTNVCTEIVKKNMVVMQDVLVEMNNGNGMFGGNGGWWWIFIIVLFWMWGGWGGNGFGRGNQAETNSDFARLAAMGNQNNNTDLLMQAINGNKDAINTLSTNLNCDVKSIDNALCSIQNAIGKVGGEVGFSAERVINAVNAGDCNVIKAISDCCCTTQRSIDSVNLNLTQMNADNRLSICQQTNTLQNAITSGFNTLSSENATRFNILGAKIDAQTQIINDKFCQLEMREMQNKIDTLRDEKNALQSSALLQQQTSNIVSQIRPCPVPAYLTCNPYGCNGGLNGYGYGYPYGYGDSCCA